MPHCSESLRGVFLVYREKLFKIISGLLFTKENEAPKYPSFFFSSLWLSVLLRKWALKLDSLTGDETTDTPRKRGDKK